MALTKPILYSIPAFDATENHTFTFNVVGGEQVVANKLVITEQESGTIVYQTKETLYAFNHILPADTLTNGDYYTAYLITYDASNNASPNSNSIQFYCYSQPSFQIDNIPDSLITNASYGFNLYYNQTEGEKLNSYSFTLYDAQGIAIANSGSLYVGEQVLPLNLQYVFSGFTNNTQYSIKANGVTINGTALETETLGFSVQYMRPEIYSIVELDSNCQEGYVLVKSNIINISGVASPYPPTYVDNNTAIDLTEDGTYVTWNEGYNLSGDFTLSLWGKEFVPDSRIIYFQNNVGDNIAITYRLDSDDNVYIDCLVTSQSYRLKYYIYSDAIEQPSSSDRVQIWVRREKGLYDIKLEIIE